MPSPSKHAFVLALLLLCGSARAQFSLTGSSPASTRWSSAQTSNFKLIYPESLDSLAKVYGSELEKARILTSPSLGMTIGQSYRRKMPVVLHPFGASSNGSVTWAPMRMDILTVPDPYSPTPIPWSTELAIHEGRHAAQMQFGASGLFRPVHYLTGEMFAGALAGIYPGPALLEGDAVVAETALSKSGRGRQASFLNYLMPAFDCGDWRDWWRWVYGSQRVHTPDYYRAGYLLVAGARVFLDDPLFSQRYFDKTMRRGGLLNLQRTIKEASGKDFSTSFRTIEEGFHGLWFAEALERSPFMPMEQVSPIPARHTEYSGTTWGKDSTMYALRSGMAHPRALVRLGRDGKEERLRSFAFGTGRLDYDPSTDRIYWTEAVPHWRWTLKADSRIRYVEASKPGKVRDLTKGRKHFHSRPSPDGKAICTIEYPSSGGSRLLLVSSSDADEEESFQAPDSLQFVEPAWLPSKDGGTISHGCRLFVTGLSRNGMGIYEVLGSKEDGKAELRVVVSPLPVEISKLGAWSEEGHLSFVCDRTGVGELHTLDTRTSQVWQLTSTRYGISDPTLSPAADTLFYSSVASSHDPSTYKQGTMVYATAVGDLPSKRVDLGDIHKRLVADILSDQERTLGRALSSKLPKEAAELSAATRFRKLRLPNVHSWAPVYFNYDNIDSFTYDQYYKTASLGATALFQSLLGDGSGFVGWSLHNDPGDKKGWRNSGHLKYTYNGFLPALELGADFGDRERLRIDRVHKTSEDGMVSVYNRAVREGIPFLDASLKAYVPIQLSSGGLSRGVVPQLKYSFTNDLWGEELLFLKEDGGEGENSEPQGTAPEKEEGRGGHFSRTLSMSIRAYVMRPAATSQIYPSLGIGAEAGYLSRPGRKRAFRDAAYIYAYGYLPGLVPQHGMKLTATFETPIGRKYGHSFPQGAVSALPRGFAGSNLQGFLNLCSTSKLKASVDYAIPLLPVDWSFLCPAAYIRNFELSAFCDLAILKLGEDKSLGINPSGITEERLVSAGLDFNVHLGNLLWLPYDTKVGVRWSMNFWNKLEQLPISGLEKHHLSFLWSIDL